MIRTLDQLVDAYHNPMHPQQRVFDSLLRAIEFDDAESAAEAAAMLAKQLEVHGIEEIEIPGVDEEDETDRYTQDRD